MLQQSRHGIIMPSLKASYFALLFFSTDFEVHEL